MKDRRVGRFSMSFDLLDDSKAKAGLRSLFGKMVVLEARSDFSRGLVEYTAHSPMFDVVPEAEIPPYYYIEVTREKGKRVKFRAVRVEDYIDTQTTLALQLKVQKVKGLRQRIEKRVEELGKEANDGALPLDDRVFAQNKIHFLRDILYDLREVLE